MSNSFRSFYCLVVVLLIVSRCVNGKQQVPCLFIFGDSLSDAGSNNNLQTVAKVNYQPYGIDFPNGPTGRFTNGRTAVDIVGQLLGFENFIQPFTTADDSQIFLGVNYASGSAGIRDESGRHMGINVNLNKQLENHRNVMSRIAKQLGNDSLAEDHLRKCLYYVWIGNNDYLLNYFLPQYYNSSKQYTPAQYTDVLIQQYSQQIKTLYFFGARKLAVNGLALIGCAPIAASMSGNNKSLCFDEMNVAAGLFNSHLISLIRELKRDFADAKFVYIDNAMPVLAVSGLNGHKSCCEVTDVGFCIPNKAVCTNRNLYLFWDLFHPTEVLNKVAAGIAYRSISMGRLI